MPAGFGLLGRLVFGLTGPRQPILGTELAGIVEAVGSDVTRFRAGNEVIAFTSMVAEQVGCDIQTGPVGQIIRADDMRRTTADGVFAAGDIARAMHNITFACADGVMAAMAMHRSLVLED